jgi:hypothetical protein
VNITLDDAARIVEILSIVGGCLYTAGRVSGRLKGLEGWVSGVAKDVKSLKEDVTEIQTQYRPNHGSSMRDAVNRIEGKISKLEGRFEQHVEETDE